MISESPQLRSLSLSAATQVWSMPELVSIICETADASSLVRLAQVNKTIFGVSLAEFYYSVSINFPHILKILAPTEEIGDRGLTFTRPLEEEDWIRFLRYTKFIKILDLREMDTSAEVFCVMDATRPRELDDLFPYLKSFSCDSMGSSNSLSSLFFHKQLECLTVKSWKHPLRLLQNIRPIATSLQRLALVDSNMKLDALTNAELIKLLHQLSTLYHLELPPPFITLQVFDILAAKQNLRVLRMSLLDEWHAGDVGDVRELFPPFDYGFRFPEGGFPVLKDLMIHDPSPDPHRHLTISSKPHNLKSLPTTLTGEPSFANVQNYFQVLAHGFTALTSLVIDASAVHEGFDSEATFLMLQPLLSLSQLETFSFSNYDPVSLADRHIEQMTRSWPLLISFTFCPRLFFEEGNTEMTLSALIAFIENCKFLEELSIAVDTSINPPRELTDNLIFPNQFEMLNLLDSTPGDVNNVAAFIADILPDEAVFYYEEDEHDAQSARMEKWRAISSLVELIRKAKRRAVRRV
ncbi:hypothetical protein SISNIDRAFT_551276 [Sistotremastrum niveocremeum HHB9708]|uniref:F-box domain-containing protein n=1 Tax=Sistotremastrum niveocremeum HHB9708 TaxID=1314777 RepID=A0A164RUU6_9AGAM|nr:hypothetical protein SISNIDRAFT_551276 [Sistotremastrum niveocremeum HHB9708]